MAEFDFLILARLIYVGVKIYGFNGLHYSPAYKSALADIYFGSLKPAMDATYAILPVSIFLSLMGIVAWPWVRKYDQMIALVSIYYQVDSGIMVLIGSWFWFNYVWDPPIFMIIHGIR